MVEERISDWRIVWGGGFPVERGAVWCDFSPVNGVIVYMDARLG